MKHDVQTFRLVATILIPVLVNVLPVISADTANPQRFQSGRQSKTDVEEGHAINRVKLDLNLPVSWKECKIIYQIAVKKPEDCLHLPGAVGLLQFQYESTASDHNVREWKLRGVSIEEGKRSSEEWEKLTHSQLGRKSQLTCCVAPQFDFSQTDKNSMAQGEETSTAGGVYSVSRVRFPHKFDIPAMHDSKFSMLGYARLKFAIAMDSLSTSDPKPNVVVSGKFKERIWTILFRSSVHQARKRKKVEKTRMWEDVANFFQRADSSHKPVILEAFFLAMNNKDYTGAVQFAWMFDEDMELAVLHFQLSPASLEMLEKAINNACQIDGTERKLYGKAITDAAKECLRKTFSSENNPQSRSKTSHNYIHLVCNTPARAGSMRHPCQRTWYSQDPGEWDPILEKLHEKLPRGVRIQIMQKWLNGEIGNYDKPLDLQLRLVEEVAQDSRFHDRISLSHTS